MGWTTGRLVLARHDDLIAPPPSARLELLDAIAAMDVPFVRRTMAQRSVVFVNDPQLVADVLVARADSFEASELPRRLLGGAAAWPTGPGDGLLASASASATRRPQRRLLERLFAASPPERDIAQIAAIARAERDRWPRGVPVELGAVFRRLATRAVARVLFSWDIAPGDERNFDDLAARLPALVAERRRRGGTSAGDSGDAIDLLLQARAEVGGAGAGDAQILGDRELRDQLTDLFLGGVENAAHPLTWTLHLLARHPEAARRIRDEIHAAGAASGDITPETLQRLPFTLHAFKEALRLYPPAYAIGRRALEDVRIGLYELERDTEVVLSPYALHRRPTLWERPTEFDPARWEHAADADRHPCAYLPFGIGARACISGGFTLRLGHVALAVWLGALGFTPASAERVSPEPHRTLHPDGPVWMVAHPTPSSA